MKKILIVTTFNNHFRFFKRLADTLSKQNYEIHFLTNRNSILKEADNYYSTSFLLKKDNGTGYVNYKLKETFEVAAGLISNAKAKIIADSVWAKVHVLHKKYDYDLIYMWSGVRLIEYVINLYSIKNKINTLFFELGNFPGKIFVDPNGTNARSLLAEDKNILSNFNYDKSLFEKWRQNYIQSSLMEHKVPQSSSAAKVDYKKNLLDLIGFRFRNLVQYEPLITKDKLIGKYLRKLVKMDFDKVDLENEKYVFFPMQVNKDAQLILNSDVGNLEALRVAANYSKEKGLKLFVKPHPAEVEIGFFKQVENLRREYDFHLVNNNTMHLINNSAKVITINSTVGLQAKLFGKEVTCLGKAFYSDFNEEELGKYINAYLIDVEFWDESEINYSTAKEIILRSELKKVN